MRGLFATLVVAVLFIAIALLAAAFGSVGVALVGLLLHRWFDLTQWQGSLIALAVAAGLTLVIYQLSHSPVQPATWQDDDWEDDQEDEDEPEVIEPPIVPWRRSRPTPGELPSDRPAGAANKSSRSPKPRK
jgi:TRAP-type C4-dicarboxylate transport system permease small subunit